MTSGGGTPHKETIRAIHPSPLALNPVKNSSEIQIPPTTLTQNAADKNFSGPPTLHSVESSRRSGKNKSAATLTKSLQIPEALVFRSSWSLNVGPINLIPRGRGPQSRGPRTHLRRGPLPRSFFFIIAFGRRAQHPFSYLFTSTRPGPR